MKTDEERGPFGVWVTGERDQRGWSIEQLVGEPFSDSYLRGIEAGRRPSTRVQRALSTVFGGAPPDVKERSADLATLVDAISALVEELRLDREVRLGIAEGIERAGEELAAPQPLEESRAPSRARQPRGTQRGSPVGAAGR